MKRKRLLRKSRRLLPRKISFGRILKMKEKNLRNRV